MVPGVLWLQSVEEVSAASYGGRALHLPVLPALCI
jgi:hypothetical protein